MHPVPDVMSFVLWFAAIFALYDIFVCFQVLAEII